MWWFDRLIEDKIERARQEGYFDNLRGAGKPLRSSGDELAGELWLAHHLMEEAGVLPEWLSLRKDIAAARPDLERFRQEVEARLEQLPLRLWNTDARLKRLIELYESRARRINLMIDDHNHRCPSIQHELVKVREDAVERAKEQIRRRRVMPYLQRSDGGRAR